MDATKVVRSAAVTKIEREKKNKESRFVTVMLASTQVHISGLYICTCDKSSQQYDILCMYAQNTLCISFGMYQTSIQNKQCIYLVYPLIVNGCMRIVIVSFYDITYFEVY